MFRKVKSEEMKALTVSSLSKDLIEFLLKEDEELAAKLRDQESAMKAILLSIQDLELQLTREEIEYPQYQPMLLASSFDPLPASASFRPPVTNLENKVFSKMQEQQLRSRIQALNLAKTSLEVR
jgi:hypothetical protein